MISPAAIVAPAFQMRSRFESGPSRTMTDGWIRRTIQQLDARMVRGSSWYDSMSKTLTESPMVAVVCNEIVMSAATPVANLPIDRIHICTFEFSGRIYCEDDSVMGVSFVILYILRIVQTPVFRVIRRARSYVRIMIARSNVYELANPFSAVHVNVDMVENDVAVVVRTATVPDELVSSDTLVAGAMVNSPDDPMTAKGVMSVDRYADAYGVTAVDEMKNGPVPSHWMV